MTHDPNPQVHPDHAHVDGRLVYDARCWMCRNITAQPPPGTTKAAGP
jgi:hypothetical protein